MYHELPRRASFWLFLFSVDHDLTQTARNQGWKTTSASVLAKEEHSSASPLAKTEAEVVFPRHTWWDHRGTREWMQYDFPQPATVSRVHVYRFDDTGRGH